MKKQEVLVVSAFGRGHWLAVDLARQGMSVALLDLTESLGIWIPEDVEGPFGLFQSDKVKDSQWERLLEDDPPMMCNQGFTVWLQDGPLELKSATTKHRLEKLGVDEDQHQFISSQATSWIFNKTALAKLNQKNFKNTWLARLALLFSSNTSQLAAAAVKTQQALPLFNNFFIRMATRQGHQRSLDWCQRNKVQLLTKAQVLDISFQGRSQIKGVEYKTIDSEKSELIEAEQVIWCLTSEETGMQGVRLQSALYPDGILEPDWVWSRYRLRLKHSLEREQLPLHCLIIPDLSLHWVHENFMVCQRTGSPELFDAWIKVPTLQRFNRDYLNMRGQKIIDLLNSKLGSVQAEISDYPLGHSLTYREVGPPRNPIFLFDEKNKLKKRSLDNLHFYSCEESELLGWEARFKLELEIHSAVKIWWDKKQEMLAKQRMKGLTK